MASNYFANALPAFGNNDILLFLLYFLKKQSWFKQL